MPEASPIALRGEALVPTASLSVHVETHALRYALSVFEGIRAYTPAPGERARLFALDAHLQRLQRSLALCRLPAVDLGALGAGLDALMQANDVREDAYLRLAVSATSHGTMTAPISVEATATLRPMGRKPWLAQGRRLGLTLGPRKSDGRLLPHEAKCIAHYAGTFLAKAAAREAGFDDVLLLDARGRLSEAATSNVFLVRGGQLVTPSLDCAILPGVTRATLLRLAAALGLEAREEALEPAALGEASEVFLCGTGSEIASVSHVDNYRFNEDHPVTDMLIEAYFREVRA